MPGGAEILTGHNVLCYCPTGLACKYRQSDSNADGQVTPGDQKDPDFRSKAGAGRQTGAAWRAAFRRKVVQTGGRKVSEAASRASEGRQAGTTPGARARTAAAPQTDVPRGRRDV